MTIFKKFLKKIAKDALFILAYFQLNFKKHLSLFFARLAEKYKLLENFEKILTIFKKFRKKIEKMHYFSIFSTKF